MSQRTQTLARLNGTARPATNSSTRPRLFGFVSTPEPFSFTDWQDQAHKANAATPNAIGGGAFGGPGRHLSGLAPKMRKRRRKALKIAGWIKRNQSAQDPNASALVDSTTPTAVAVAPTPGKLARLFRRLGLGKGAK